MRKLVEVMRRLNTEGSMLRYEWHKRRARPMWDIEAKDEGWVGLIGGYNRFHAWLRAAWHLRKLWMPWELSVRRLL